MARSIKKRVASMTEKIDWTKDSEYRRMYGSKSDEKTMERKGRDTPSTKTSRQNSQKDKR
jgi:hypothetical protein